MAGSEIGKERPALVISDDTVNASPLKRSTVIPMSTRSFENPMHVRVDPPQGGLEEPSWVVCDYQRTVSHARLIRYLGRVTPETLAQVAWKLAVVLGLPAQPPGPESEAAAEESPSKPTD
jgi:mRNA interferase MazF